MELQLSATLAQSQLFQAKLQFFYSKAGDILPQHSCHYMAKMLGIQGFELLHSEPEGVVHIKLASLAEYLGISCLLLIAVGNREQQLLNVHVQISKLMSILADNGSFAS